jgi:hypothetical protein
LNNEEVILNEMSAMMRRPCDIIIAAMNPKIKEWLVASKPHITTTSNDNGIWGTSIIIMISIPRVVGA